MFAMQGGGRDAMAALAAKLMGGSDTPSAPTVPTPSPASAAHKATIPRTVPSSQAVPTQPTTQQTGHSEPPRELASFSTAPPTTSMGATIPNPVPPATMGPSLRGTADQLKEAREFMSGATAGNSKSRPASRQRVLSQEPSRVGVRSSRSSAGSGASSTSYAPAVAAARPRPSMTTTASAPRNAVGAAGGLSQWQALRDQAPSGVQSPVKNGPAPSSATQTTPIKTESSGQKPLPAFTFTSTVEPAFKDSPPSPQKDSCAIPVPEAAHKRNKSTVPEHVIRGGPLASASKNQESKFIGETNSPEIPQSTADITSAESALGPKAMDVEYAVDSKHAEVPSNNGNATVVDNSGDSKVQEATGEAAQEPPVNGEFGSSVDEEDDNRAALHLLKEKVAAMNDRVAALEDENFKLQKQVESLVQRDERRRFLGTESANTPFGVDVKDVHGNIIRVQGSKCLTVGDLIRRVRVKANMSSAASKNPRIALGEQELGHAMMLGEVGVQQDSVLLFKYD